MEATLTNIWVYLAETPLLWLAATLLAYQAAYWLYWHLWKLPVFNPVLLAIVLLVGLLLATGTPYETYFEGAQFVHFLLGPATVALAVPLYSYMDRLRAMLLPLGAALLVGCITAIVSVVVLGQVFGLSETPLLSLVPKSVTTPIAMGVAEQIGGLPSLTAVLVILTGILGAVGGMEILGLLGFRESSVRGFALGVASHGIGTARAFQHDEESGAFSGLAMGLNGALTALLVPLLLRWLGL